MGLLLLVENIFGVGVYWFGDVVCYYGGMIIEVCNIDVEGWLVFVDVFVYVDVYFDFDVLVDIVIFMGVVMLVLGCMYVVFYFVDEWFVVVFV